MVAASSTKQKQKQQKQKQKNAKKNSKRKPVNLLANFNSKCSSAGARRTACDVSLDAISAAMFPSNDHYCHHAAIDSLDAGGFACGDFHLHRWDVRDELLLLLFMLLLLLLLLSGGSATIVTTLLIAHVVTCT